MQIDDRKYINEFIADPFRVAACNRFLAVMNIRLLQIVRPSLSYSYSYQSHDEELFYMEYLKLSSY